GRNTIDTACSQVHFGPLLTRFASGRQAAIERWAKMSEAIQKAPVSRRKLLATAAGAAAALGAAGLPVLQTAKPAIGEAKLHAEPLIPEQNRGIILYSVRDRISAAPDSTGVPYGFERVLARIAELGYKEVEFAGYTQSTAILGRQI